MGERLRSPDEMASTSAGGATTVLSADEVDVPEPPVTVITLRPTKTVTRKKVIWTEDTVDNENMNKKKSKCCCIYEKPRKFDESSSSSSDEEDCEHCFGHVEKRKKHGAGGAATASDGGGGGSTVVEETPPAEHTHHINITLRPPEGEPGPPDKATPPLNVS